MADFLELLVTKGRKGADTASAGTLVVPITGDRFDITGTTGITAFDTGTREVGSRFYLRFSGVLTLTHDGVGITLNDAANITTAAGDVVLFEVTATDTVRQLTPFGIAGAPGADGADGADGAPGADGADGADASPIPRVTTMTSSATPTPNADATDHFILTAQAAAAAFANPTGTPASGQKLLIQIYSAAAQALTWGTDYVARGADFPSTTTAGKWLTIGLIYNAAESTFDCVAVAEEA